MKLLISDLRKAYGEHVALDGISLSTDDSVRCLALIGPSGGGKSTLLRIVGGLETADTGTVALDGADLPRSPSALLGHRRRIGYLFQSFNLFPHMDALRNITLPLEKVHRFPAAEAKERAEACLSRLGLAEHRAKRPAQLSGGQQQRVAIARALAIRPRLLILDEPTSALDPEMTAEVLDVIRELAESGQEIILSTHEMGFARAVADRVALLAAGKVAETGPAEDLFAAPASETARRFLARVMRY